MIKTYYAISSLYEVMKKELKDEPEIIDIKTKADNFKSRKYIFQIDILTTKIVVIGCTSVGKSSLINKLIERNIYGCETLHGTTAFFYTTASSKSYEYLTINGTHEIKDVSILKSATRIDELLEGYINIDTEIKTYLKSNNSGFLKSSFVIVDCPGLEQEENYKEKIINQCMHADIILFLFDVNQRARQQEMEVLKELYKKNPNVCPYFVYNKCDTVDLNINQMVSLKEDFRRTFGELFKIYCKMDASKFYFLSSNSVGNKNNGSLLNDELGRFKNDVLKNIKIQSNQSFHSLSQSIKDLEEVERILKEIFKRKMKSKNEIQSEIKSHQTINCRDIIVTQFEPNSKVEDVLDKMKTIENFINQLQQAASEIRSGYGI